MAWRPNTYFLEGELDNTTPGRVTGWMRFAGLPSNVTFDLIGNFHRDIRGARIRMRGDADPNDPAAADYMKSFAPQQTGQVGDITAGRQPCDYVAYPYIEWYSDANGRVVLNFEPGEVEVIGQPIPACESDPVSREEQQEKMAQYLSKLSAGLNMTAILAGPDPLVSDPAFTHWLVEDGRITGEAHSVEPGGDGVSTAYLRRFAALEEAGHGRIASGNLRRKDAPESADP